MKIQFYETLLFALSVLSAVSTATAENSRGFGAPSEGPAYSNSESGLKHLIQDALNAARENDQAKLAELTNSMILPSSEDWFLRVFGPLRGKFYARLYAENSGRIAKDLSEIFAELASDKFGNFEVREFKGSCDLRADQDEYPVLAERVTPEAFSVVRFVRGKSVRNMRFLAYVDGGFRFLGQLHASDGYLSDVGKARVLKPDSNVSSGAISGSSADIPTPQAIHRVQPDYSSDVRSRHIEGTVVLHVIINKDGTVGEMRLMRGQCPLAKAAIEAVGQWRFEPSLLAGKPVQVEAVFEVNFSMV
jgi:TonB family protein